MMIILASFADLLRSSQIHCTMSTVKRAHEQADPNKTTPANKRVNPGPDDGSTGANSVCQIDPDGDLVLYTPGNRLSADDEHDATFLVSSKHLTLASAWFKAYLSDRWYRDPVPADEGRAKIAIKDCQPETLLILLRMIHGFSRKVPQKVSFEQLVDISLAAEFYQCTEVVEPYVHTWMRVDQVWNPTDEDPNFVAKCIIVAWIFKIEHVLSVATKAATESSTDPFEAPDLPFPAFIKDAIDNNRTAWLGMVLREIETHVAQLLSANCLPDCDAYYLGRVLQHLARHNVFFRLAPQTSLPLLATSASLSGLSVQNIRDMIESLHCDPSYSHSGMCLNRLAPWGQDVPGISHLDCAECRIPQ